MLEKVLNFLSKKENSLEEYTTIIDITMSVCPPETKYIVFLRNWLSNLDTHFWIAQCLNFILLATCWHSFMLSLLHCYSTICVFCQKIMIAVYTWNPISFLVSSSFHLHCPTRNIYIHVYFLLVFPEKIVRPFLLNRSPGKTKERPSYYFTWTYVYPYGRKG